MTSNPGDNQPLVSPDGMWAWDGTQWLPTSANATAALSDPREQRRAAAQQQLDGRNQPLTLQQLVGLIAAVAVIGFIVFAAVSGQKDSNAREDRYNELHCQQYGEHC